jgi:hypothetical protein
MSGQRRLFFELLDYIIYYPINPKINPVGDIVELVHLADNGDRVLFSTTTGVILYLHVCSLCCCTNRRLEFVWGDCHRGGSDVRCV